MSGSKPLIHFQAKPFAMIYLFFLPARLWRGSSKKNRKID
jgi:hypothetical protein